MNKYTFTDEGIYIVGFDLGGTLLVVGCVAERKSLDAIDNLIATHRENRTRRTNNTYFVGLLFATDIRCVRIGICKTIRF